MFRKEKNVGFIQPAFYSLIVNKKNFRNISEKMYTCLFLICVNIYQMFIYL